MWGETCENVCNEKLDSFYEHLTGVDSYNHKLVDFQDEKGSDDDCDSSFMLSSTVRDRSYSQRQSVIQCNNVLNENILTLTK